MEIFEVMTPEGQNEKEMRARILESIDYAYHGRMRDQIYKLGVAESGFLFKKIYFLNLCDTRRSGTGLTK